MNRARIPDTHEAWDDKRLGSDEDYVEVVNETEEAQIDEAAGTQPVSIRQQNQMPGANKGAR